MLSSTSPPRRYHRRKQRRCRDGYDVDDDDCSPRSWNVVPLPSLPLLPSSPSSPSPSSVLSTAAATTTASRSVLSSYSAGEGLDKGVVVGTGPDAPDAGSEPKGGGGGGGVRNRLRGHGTDRRHRRRRQSATTAPASLVLVAAAAALALSGLFGGVGDYCGDRDAVGRAGGSKVRGVRGAAGTGSSSASARSLGADTGTGTGTGTGGGGGAASYPHSISASAWAAPSIGSSSPHVSSTAAAGPSTGAVLLLGIFSTRSKDDKRRRQLIRDTYLTHGYDHRVCYLGMFERLLAHDGDRARSKCSVVYTFVVGAAYDDGPTEHVEGTKIALDPQEVGDADMEGDVTFLNIRENMNEGKSETWLKYGAYLSETYRFDYIAKADSDTYLNVDALITFVDSDLPPSPYNVRMYGGLPWPNYQRSSLYMAGQFYFLSIDLARYVTYALTPEERAVLREPIRTEDAEIGNLVHASNELVTLVIVSPSMFWFHPVKTEKEWMAYGNRWGRGGRRPWRNAVVPWREIVNIWRKEGLIEIDR